MSRTIPIFHCFDHNYVLPAAVAFRSMLDHAKSPDTTYALSVVGRDLTEEDRAQRVLNYIRETVFALPYSEPYEWANEVYR